MFLARNSRYKKPDTWRYFKALLIVKKMVLTQKFVCFQMTIINIAGAKKFNALSYKFIFFCIWIFDIIIRWKCGQNSDHLERSLRKKWKFICRDLSLVFSNEKFMCFSALWANVSRKFCIKRHYKSLAKKSEELLLLIVVELIIATLVLLRFLSWIMKHSFVFSLLLNSWIKTNSILKTY